MGTEQRKVRVLIIDDDPESRDILTGSLELLNPQFEIEHESRVEGAEQRLIDERQRFDLITLDPDLFGKSPIELLRRLRNEGIKTPVILNAADTTLETWRSYRGLGINGYLPKPTDPLDFQDNVSRILQRFSPSIK